MSPAAILPRPRGGVRRSGRRLRQLSAMRRLHRGQPALHRQPLRVRAEHLRRAMRPASGWLLQRDRLRGLQQRRELRRRRTGPVRPRRMHAHWLRDRQRPALRQGFERLRSDRPLRRMHRSRDLRRRRRRRHLRVQAAHLCAARRRMRDDRRRLRKASRLRTVQGSRDLRGYRRKQSLRLHAPVVHAAESRVRRGNRSLRACARLVWRVCCRRELQRPGTLWPELRPHDAGDSLRGDRLRQRARRVWGYPPVHQHVRQRHYLRRQRLRLPRSAGVRAWGVRADVERLRQHAQLHRLPCGVVLPRWQLVRLLRRKQPVSGSRRQLLLLLHQRGLLHVRRRPQRLLRPTRRTAGGLQLSHGTAASASANVSTTVCVGAASPSG